MGTLRERMQKELVLKGLSPRTRKIYVGEVEKFIRHHAKSPESLGSVEIKEYLHYLITSKGVASSAVNQAYSALKFFYHNTLGRPWEFTSIPRTRRPKILPVILERDEIDAILAATRNVKHRTILSIIYSAGLRVSEATRLRVVDIDGKRMQIRVQQAKGLKDRYTVLSREVLGLLREYWSAYRPAKWLFSGYSPQQPVSVRTVQKVFEMSCKKAGIKKPVSIHTLRHSFATHMLENGVGIHHIQLLLGHSSPRTTAVYLHVKRNDLVKIESPLDTYRGTTR
jgi:integrase/recombinase XerD